MRLRPRSPPGRHGQSAAGREQQQRTCSRPAGPPGLPGGGRPPRVSPPPPGPPLSCAPPPIAFSPHRWATASTPGPDGAPPAAVGAGGPPPGLEQELGARLRRLGDAFQRAYELQPPQRRGGSFWGHVYRLVSQLLGAIYNLQAAALPPRHHD